MSNKSVLFVYTHFSTFVSKDYDILSTAYRVDKYHFLSIKSPFRLGLQLLRQFFYLLVFILKYDAVFVWFADYHSFFPITMARILGKKAYLVNGGYDLTYLPEYRYGSFNNPIRSYMTKKSLNRATCCFPVAEALKEKLLAICPGANAETLPTSQDAERFNYSVTKREKRVVTLSTTDNFQRFMIKGLDRFRELAILMEDYQFIVYGVGEKAQQLFEPTPPNLIMLPSISHKEIPALFEKASFYAQFSRSEGLPNAVCEAMLCGCIPLGTNVGDIQTAIGPTGLTLETWDPKAAAHYIRRNHNNPDQRKAARERVITLYDRSIREKRLTSLL